MRKQNAEDKMLKLLSTVVDHKAKKIDALWPPICTGLLHQPKRPER